MRKVSERQSVILPRKNYCPRVHYRIQTTKQRKATTLRNPTYLWYWYFWIQNPVKTNYLVKTCSKNAMYNITRKLFCITNCYSSLLSGKDISRGKWRGEILPTLGGVQIKPEYHLSQALSGHGAFGSYLVKMKRRNNDACECGEAIETPEHNYI